MIRPKLTRTLTIAGAAIVAATWAAGAYYSRTSLDTSAITTVPVTRGAIVDAVSATGTLEAVTTVQVGAQLSGTVQNLYADFNSIVRKGDVIARLDPSFYDTQVEQARANLIRAEADADRLAVSVADARTKLARAREMSALQLIPAVDLEAAEVALSAAEAQLRSARAQVTQANAALNQAQVNLEKTVITAPIDGIVIARNVDVEQTVAASLSAPTLYVIAADLTKMRVNASIDESAVGRVAAGQPVTFRVDAYPDETFTGTVAQIRLNPVTVQNVVTYVGMIDVPNPGQKLKPGMTATVTIEIDRRDEVLRVPAAALRFRPTAEMLVALGQARAPRAGAPPAGVARAARAAAASRSDRTIWVPKGDGVEPVVVTLGLSDGAFTEIVAGPVEAGSPVVTAVVRASSSASSAASPASSGVSNPLMGQQFGPPGAAGRSAGAPGGAR